MLGGAVPRQVEARPVEVDDRPTVRCDAPGPGPMGPLTPWLPAVHAGTLVVAFAVWAVLDRNLWFYGDEWDFLTRRGLHGAYFSLWAPHNEHWSVLPVLLWRGLYSLFHLTTYWPYLVPLLAAHVGIVHLVWRRSLNEGADPWLATFLAGLLALFGPGGEDLTWAFQIGFLGSVVLGLASWELAERRGNGARSWVADVGVAALALAAMMCSTVGLACAAGLAVVLLARSGWRRMAGVLCGPVACYAVWFVLIGHEGMTATGDVINLGVFLRAPFFIAWNLADVLGSTAALVFAGPVLVLALAIWLIMRPPELARRRYSALAGAAAAVTFFALAALGRDRISWTMSPSRYLYVGAAFLLPVVAVALTGYLRRARAHRGEVGMRHARVPIVVVILVATAANLNGGVNIAAVHTSDVQSLKDQIITSGALLQDKVQLDRALNPYPVRGSGRRAGYLSPSVLAGLYARHLVGPVSTRTMGASQVLVDESWLDVTGGARPGDKGRFRLGALGGYRLWYLGPPTDSSPPAAGRTVLYSTGRARSWPAGPGHCTLAVPPSRLPAPVRPHPYWLRLNGQGRGRTASVWVSLGQQGGLLYVSLAQPWGDVPAHRVFHLSVRGEQLHLGPDQRVWVNESVPGDGLVLRTEGRAPIEVCALAAQPQQGRSAVKL